MALTATMATADGLLRDCFLPPLGHELRSEGIVHNCGEPYKLAFLDNGDGRLFRSVQAMDAYEAILTARCENPMCGHRDTQYNYARLALTGSMLYSLRADEVVRVVKLHLDSVWHDLKEHLKGVNPPVAGATISNVSKILQQHYLPAIKQQLNQPMLIHDALNWNFATHEDASIAEWITEKLVEVGGKLHVSKLGGAEWKPQRIIDVADQMGFVKWPHLRLPEEHPLAA